MTAGRVAACAVGGSSAIISVQSCRSAAPRAPQCWPLPHGQDRLKSQGGSHEPGGQTFANGERRGISAVRGASASSRSARKAPWIRHWRAASWHPRRQPLRTLRAAASARCVPLARTGRDPQVIKPRNSLKCENWSGSVEQAARIRITLNGCPRCFGERSSLRGRRIRGRGPGSSVRARCAGGGAGVT